MVCCSSSSRPLLHAPRLLINDWMMASAACLSISRTPVAGVVPPNSSGPSSAWAEFWVSAAPARPGLPLRHPSSGAVGWRPPHTRPERSTVGTLWANAGWCPAGCRLRTSLPHCSSRPWLRTQWLGAVLCFRGLAPPVEHHFREGGGESEL